MMKRCHLRFISDFFLFVKDVWVDVLIFVLYDQDVKVSANILK